MLRSSSHRSQGEALEGLGSACPLPIEVRQLAGDEEQDRKLVKEALGSAPKVVVALGQLAAERLSEMSPRPAFLAAFTPSDAAPRGVRTEPPPELEIEQLLKLRPKCSRLGVLFDPAISRGDAEEVEKAARAKGLAVELSPAAAPTDVPRAFRDAVAKVDALLVLPSRVIVGSREALSFLVLGCLEKSVLLYTRSEALVKGGALFSLVADPTDVGRSLGSMVNQALAAPGTEGEAWRLPRRHQLVLNRRTGKALGLTLPASDDPGSDLVRISLDSGKAAEFRPARVARRAPPKMPAGGREALKAGASGVVVLRVRVSRDGRLVDKVLLKGDPPFAEAAPGVIDGWSFEPAVEDGVPVESSLVLTVTYGDAP